MNNDPYDRSIGPQISFDKSYLCMMTEVCKIKQDQGKWNQLQILIFFPI